MVVVLSTAMVGAAVERSTQTAHLSIVYAWRLTWLYDESWIDGIRFKLASIGFKGNILRWIGKFLNNRTLQVQIGQEISNTGYLKKGVPQGSSLSPTLFKIFLMDFPKPLTKNGLALFADDVALFTQAKTSEEAESNLNPSLEEINQWAEKWKLRFAAAKSAMVVFSRRTKYKISPVLKINEEIIPQSNTQKFLGVLFDERLNWKAFINDLLDKGRRTSQLMRVIGAQKNNIRPKTLLKIYKTLMLSRLDYGSPLLAYHSKSPLLKVETLQNDQLRLVTGALRSTPIGVLQLETGIWPLKERRKWMVKKFLVKLGIKKDSPTYKRLRHTYTSAQHWKSGAHQTHY